MELSIVLTNENIYIAQLQVRGKSILLQKTMQTKMPEGGFQNGIIVNTIMVAKSISDLLRENKVHTKKALICATGTDIMQKELTIPAGNNKDMLGMIEKELMRQDMLTNEYIVDYIPSDSDESPNDTVQTVIAYLLPKALIQNYQQTLVKAGLTPVRLDPIDYSMEKLSKLLEIDSKSKMTFLVNAEKSAINLLMTGQGIKSLYRNIIIKAEDSIEENIFIVSAVQKIQTALDETGMIVERLSEEISKLIQFQSQTSRENNEGEVIVYGDLADNPEFLQQLEAAVGLPVKKCEMPKGKVKYTENTLKISSIQTLGTGCGKLLKLKKELSFFKMFEQKKAGHLSRHDLIPLTVGLCIVALTALAYVATTVINYNYEKKITGYETAILNGKNRDDYQQKVFMRKEIEALSQYNKICNKYIETLENTQRLEPSVFSSADALTPVGIHIETHSYQNAAAIFAGKAERQDGPAQFAEIITNAKLFSSIKYEGFNTGIATDGKHYYNFQLECGLLQKQGD